MTSGSLRRENASLFDWMLVVHPIVLSRSILSGQPKQRLGGDKKELGEHHGDVRLTLTRPNTKRIRASALFALFLLRAVS